MPRKKPAPKLSDEEYAAEVARRRAEATALRMVYQGERLSTAKPGTRVHQWCVVDGEKLGEVRYFSGKNLTAASLGGVYVVYQAPTGSIWVGGELAPHYDGRWHDTGEIMAWQVEDRQTNIVLTAKKRQADEDVNEALRALEPLHRLYKRTNYQGQRAIEVLLLEYLRRA